MNKIRLTQVYVTVDISESELKGKHTSLKTEQIIGHF